MRRSTQDQPAGETACHKPSHGNLLIECLLSIKSRVYFEANGNFPFYTAKDYVNNDKRRRREAVPARPYRRGGRRVQPFLDRYPDDLHTSYMYTNNKCFVRRLGNDPGMKKSPRIHTYLNPEAPEHRGPRDILFHNERPKIWPQIFY